MAALEDTFLAQLRNERQDLAVEIEALRIKVQVCMGRAWVHGMEAAHLSVNMHVLAVAG